MKYISTKEASAKWGISATRITILANEGRIPGAQRMGSSWIIPADATKPPKRKANQPHPDSVSPEKGTDDFAFPLFHFRPDWDSAKETQLSVQQKSLLRAETAMLECRFEEAYSLLETLLAAPDDIGTELGCLWSIGMCCITLNRPDDFSRVFLRLQLLLSEDIPHRDDYMLLFDCLKTYVETIDSFASDEPYSENIHEQSVPMACMMAGYRQLTKEAMKPRAADAALLEVTLRSLQFTGSIFILEMMHCHLMGIYSMRSNIEAAKRHAKALVQLAYENKVYFPLVTYYSYNVSILSPILDQYPEEFQQHCCGLASRHKKNYTAFLSALAETAVIAKLTEADYPYVVGVLMGLNNISIAKKTGVTQQTVKRKLDKLCEKLGVANKKELRDYLRKYM